jgi:hypothetical protein
MPPCRAWRPDPIARDVAPSAVQAATAGAARPWHSTILAMTIMGRSITIFVTTCQARIEHREPKVTIVVPPPRVARQNDGPAAGAPHGGELAGSRSKSSTEKVSLQSDHRERSVRTRSASDRRGFPPARENETGTAGTRTLPPNTPFRRAWPAACKGQGARYSRQCGTRPNVRIEPVSIIRRSEMGSDARARRAAVRARACNTSHPADEDGLPSVEQGHGSGLQVR